MSRKFQRLENRRKCKRYTPHPHPEVTAALEAAGLKPDKVYEARRWERGSVDLDRLAGALHALTCKGWRLSPVTVYAVRYPAERRAASIGFPVLPTDALELLRRLEIDRARGLAFVFDRSPDAIAWHLERYRALMASVNADPMRRISADPQYARFLTKGEMGALSTFCGAYGRFHAAIGNVKHVGPSGEGVPMGEDARKAAQDAYAEICARILKRANALALSACQDLAANRGLPSKWRLQEAAHAIDPELPAIPGEEAMQTARAGG